MNMIMYTIFYRDAIICINSQGYVFFPEYYVFFIDNIWLQHGQNYDFEQLFSEHAIAYVAGMKLLIWSIDCCFKKEFCRFT